MAFVAPIGISDFRLLRQHGATYVDKTASIGRVLASPTQALLFPRPRRFGKTLWLSTLQAFVERGDDDRAALFADLAIWGHAAARAHMGRYPIVFMTFKDVKHASWGARPGRRYPDRGARVPGPRRRTPDPERRRGT